METYCYKAKHLLSEKIIHGEINGEDREEVKEILGRQYLYPLKIKSKSNSKRINYLFTPKIKLSELNFFCKQFAGMIDAGIHIDKALELGAQQMKNRVLKRHLFHVQKQIDQGKSLSKALDEEGIFPKLLVHMVVSGEASGHLENVLNQVVHHFEDQLGLRKKVMKALTYPAFVLGMVVVVLIILMIRVIPRYIQLLEDTGANVPLPTQIIINMSHYLSLNQGKVLIGMLLLIIGLGYLFQLSFVKKQIQVLMLRVPVIGNLKKKRLSVDFASTLSMLVESGVPMLRAMEISRDVMGHAVSEVEMNEAIEVLKNGNSLYDAVHSSIIFPTALLSVIKIGEETGKLDEMLKQISKFLKEEVEASVDYMTVFIEPILISFVALVVGGVMAAIILPTFSAAISAM